MPDLGANLACLRLCEWDRNIQSIFASLSGNLDGKGEGYEARRTRGWISCIY